MRNPYNFKCQLHSSPETTRQQPLPPLFSSKTSRRVPRYSHDTTKSAPPKPHLAHPPNYQGQPSIMAPASAQLGIAKASLLAALLKPSPEAGLPPCSRDDIEQFHGLLSAAIAQCSPTNIQVWTTHAAPFLRPPLCAR